MLKRFITALVIFSVSHSISGQTFTGFNTGVYAGIAGAELQPASIADNLYTWDVTILGASAYFDNNYYTFVRDKAFFNFNFSDFEATTPRSDETRYGYAVQEVRGPSFMVALSPLDAFGFTTRVRSFGIVDNFTPELANAISDEFRNPQDFDDVLFNQGFAGDVMSWNELGLTYARVVQYQDEHYWKVGGTVKFLLGNGSVYASANSFDLQIDSSRVVTFENVLLDFGHSDNLNGVEENDFSFSPSGFSIAFDLGIVYERRPQQRYNPVYSQFRSRKPKRNDRPYLYRLGFSLLDLGRLGYTYGTTSGTADEITLDESINLDDKFGSIENGQQLIDSLQTFTNLQVQTGKYTMGLPSTFQVNFDYNLRRGFYLNANVVANLRPLKFSDRTVQTLSNLTVTPRYENDIFGAYLPVAVNSKGQANLGFGFRVGPLVLGMHNILAILTQKELESAGAYFMIKTFTLGKKRYKSELECKDLYDGWKSRKRKSGKEKKNYGDSPNLKKVEKN